MISVYSKQTETELNIRKLESIRKYNQLIQWGRRHPTKFIEKIFKLELLDYQKWIILNTWDSENAVWVCSRNAGKSFMLAIYMMARALLFPIQSIYIMAPTSNQAKETFSKLEDIAKRNIASIVGSSDIFHNEIVKSNANKDGFLHAVSKFKFEMYNGSSVETLVGVAENVVGIRSALNVYDEAGKIDPHYFSLTEPFTTQNTDFKTGKGFNAKVYPKMLPTQCLYASSAEGVDSHLWSKYKDCAKNMLIGKKGYFCADINCEMPLNPVLNGEPFPALLNQSKIDAAMRNNEARAMREYYNIFDHSGGSDAAVSRMVILRNEEMFLPISSSEGEDRHYVLCYDPAMQRDNSFVLIAEIYKDPEKGYMAKVVNGINLIKNLGGNNKQILRLTEQIEWIWKLIDGYNNKARDYGNVDLYVDAGAGGQGRSIGDLLLQGRGEGADFKPGITDPIDEGCISQKKKYPTAKERLHLMEPTKYKTLMYTALTEMMEQDLIKIPKPLPMSGEWEMEDGSVKTLTQEEIRALLEIDLMKEEIMSIQKIKTEAQRVVYKLPPSKERKMKDDRAYCLALLGWHLSELRRSEGMSTEGTSMDFADFLTTVQSQSGSAKQGNLFGGVQANPFGKYIK